MIEIMKIKQENQKVRFSRGKVHYKLEMMITMKAVP